jgi:5'-deoxynucleotidase YfbR-like HD superfamily hydrolase
VSLGETERLRALDYLRLLDEEKKVGKNESVALEEERILESAIRDSIALKRMIKWGYVRQFGGLYASECDSVAAHSGSVAILSLMIANQHRDRIQKECDVAISTEDVALMALFHDFGEGRSGDTGALSFSIRGRCELHSLEREGLIASLHGQPLRDRVLALFDEYRGYSTPEAIIVHMADNLEGFEKALHAARGSREVLADGFRILDGNRKIYKRKEDERGKLGAVAEYLVSNVLLPGRKILLESYGLSEPQ